MNGCISMATLQCEVVDCRMIQLELEYCQFAAQQVKLLAEYCFAETVELLDGAFYINWEHNNRRIKEDQLYKKIQNSCGFDFTGYVFSNVVYNAKTFKSYQQRLFFDTTTPWEALEVPIDYKEAFRQHFENVTSADACKEALVKIFNENGRKKMALWHQWDVCGGFYQSPYTNFPDRYHGRYRLRVSLACLGSNAIPFSEKLSAFATGIAAQFPNISARVALSPIGIPSPCSGHMEYFGGRIEGDKPHKEAGYWDIEWEPYYYLQGAEWFNILSPLQQTHVPDILQRVKSYPDIFAEVLPNGHISVQSRKTIVDTDVTDLLQMKLLLYNALYPGVSVIKLEHLFDRKLYRFMTKPRHRWEYVPMIAEEIEITKDSVLFRHKNNCTV